MKDDKEWKYRKTSELWRLKPRTTEIFAKGMQTKVAPTNVFMLNERHETKKK